MKFKITIETALDTHDIEIFAGSVNEALHNVIVMIELSGTVHRITGITAHDSEFDCIDAANLLGVERDDDEVTQYAVSYLEAAIKNAKNMVKK